MIFEGAEIMKKTNDENFVNAFKNFYDSFFNCIAESVIVLSDIQEEYEEQYKKIVEFNENPQILEELVNNLPMEKQAILLRILLKAGEFGRKFSNLMEMSAEDKRSFAKDLKKFSADIKKM
jgi:hypothetical protein